MFNPDGTYMFTPNNNFIGTASYTYKVCSSGPTNVCDTTTLTIEVRPIEIAPINAVIAQDDHTSTPLNTPVTACIKCNDSDPQGDALGSVVLLPGAMIPPGGTVVLNANGSVTFTPPAGFTGTVKIPYRICDIPMVVQPVACDIADLYITVLPITIVQNQTYANDDAYITTINAKLSGNVGLNDTDPQGDGSMFNLVGTPVNGTVMLNMDGTFMFTPNPGYFGPAQFVYSKCDKGIPTACDTATVYITIHKNYATISDFVWRDLNGNGIQDSGEPGQANVHAYLYNCANGSFVAKDTTDSNGKYAFDRINAAGDYFVRFDLQPTGLNNHGFTVANSGSNPNKDSDVNSTGTTPCIHVELGYVIDSIDAGIVEFASIGNFAWFDKNANGVQESGENGIADVLVTLYDGSTNLQVRSTLTDVNGLYRFDRLMPMTYYLKFTPPVSGNWNLTTPNVGSDIKDSDVDGSNGVSTTAKTLLSPGEDDLTWDAGYWKCSMISGRVWYDTDKDGVFDNDENGLNGLGVYLVDAMTKVNVTKVSTMVNPNTPSDDGYYKFSCVKPGMYYLLFERPGHLAATDAFRGGNPDKDSDIGHENGVNTTRKLTISSDNMLLNIGAGFQDKALVGDFVWLDANYNGLQDPGENPVEGVKVYALRSDGTVVSESETESSGRYMLDGIAQGDYYVRFEPPTEYGFTVPKAGNDDIDNDADGTNGYGTTRMYRISGGDQKPNVDAGLILAVLPLEWLSFNGRYNGVYSELEWKTGLEINNDHFEVERKHESESDFSKISEILASSDSKAKLHQYRHDDYELSKSGIYYYRIKQVDRNGKSNYSKVISIYVDAARELSVSIYPNPTDNLLNISLGLSEDSELEVRVFDESGKNVLTNPFGGYRKAGHYKEVLNTELLTVGHYNLQIKTSNGLINKKFSIAR